MGKEQLARPFGIARSGAILSHGNTGLPSIGAIPGYPRCFAVLGYGGNGITFSMLAAELLTAALSGRRDPDAELFEFGK